GGTKLGWARDSVSIKRESGAPAAIPSADDDEDPALWLLRGGIFFAQDPEAIGGRCGFPGVGGGDPARVPHDLGFPQASSAGAAGVVPPDVADHVGDRDDEAGAGGVGREQGEGQREQAQGDELQADEGDREAAAGRGATVVGGSGSRRCRRGCPVWEGSARGRTAGGVTAAGNSYRTDSASPANT